MIEVIYLGEWPGKVYQVVNEDDDSTMVLSEDKARTLLEQLVRTLYPGQADDALAVLP